MAGLNLKCCALAVAVAGVIFTGQQLAEAAEAETNAEQQIATSAQGIVQDNTQAEKKLKISSEYTFTNNSVSGPGESSSSLSRGSHFTDVLTFDWNNKNTENKGLSLNFILNITDDSTVDVKKLSLTNFLLNYEGLNQSINLGDVMGSFSPYSLSGSVKGLAYRYQDEAAGPEINLIYGSQYSRWDNFWDNDPATQSTNREVGGINFKHALSDAFTFGLNFVKTHDHPSLLNESGIRYDTHVWSANWEYRPTPFWTYAGEFAKSTSGESLAGEGSTKYSGNALNLSSVMEKGKTRFAAEYERVTPNFLTQTGCASVDKEKIKVNWRDRLGLGSTYHTTVYWDRNNLEDQLTASTQNIDYEMGVTWQQAFGRENGSFDVSLVRNREHDTDTTNCLEKTLNFNYTDTFNGIDTNATVGYTRNDTVGEAKQYNWSHNLTLSTNLMRGNTYIMPTLTIAHTKQALSDFTSRVMTREYSLGATITYEGGNSLSLTGGWKSADYYDLSDDSNNWFANINWTFKPAFLKALGATSMYLKVGINDYTYTTYSRNYRENSISTGVRCEF